ncbi:hypothetical protein JKF63_01893 [Porcisia hertigi]|uniref:Treble clef zinc finger domain-containing protein n=1 Tax=Porcisia hertigi TaxID=2761500 RepID=A0A836L0T2_9TRYP|nr:hypothetical protein JKF63_01893 [Porcisia hertigi]
MSPPRMPHYSIPYSCYTRLTTTITFPATMCVRSGRLPVSGSLHPSRQPVLLMPVRYKSSTIRIANRKKVEMFVGKRYHLPTRLRTAAPDIAVEWDYGKNPMHLYPDIVSIGYMYPVYWKCQTCANSYQMSVEKRVVRGGGCPVCEDRERSRSTACDTAPTTAGGARSGGADVGGGGATLPLLPGEENRSLRPKRTTMLNLRTKY